MEYAVDQIVDDIVVLENVLTREIKRIKKDKLPCNVHEGSILSEVDNSFVLNTSLEDRRRSIIQEKMNRLKNKEK